MFTNLQEIQEYFPLVQARAIQADALGFVSEAVQLGMSDIVIEAPTGTGKSGIGACASYWLSGASPTPETLQTYPSIAAGAYYVVTQKLLQDQMERDIARYREGFNDGVLIKTSEEYQCLHHTNCGAGSRLKSKCAEIKAGNCTYRLQKSAFLSARLGVTNYAYFFAEREYAGQLGPRHLMVADECHNLESEIIRFSDAVVTSEDIDQWHTNKGRPKIKTVEQFAYWLGKIYVPDLQARYEDMTDALGDSAEQSQELVDLDKHICKLNRATAEMSANPKGWVFWVDAAEDNPRDLTYIARPLYAPRFFDGMVRAAAPIRIYMSAHPGSKRLFCKNLGLDPRKVAWYSCGSPFEPESRPIFFMPQGSMGSANVAGTLPVALRKVHDLAARHDGERGLIHCVSYKLGEAVANMLASTMPDRPVIFPKKADERDEAMVTHAKTPGSILISPSMTEGFDFSDDLARWQIILKCPYAYLGDRFIEARMQADPDWYQLKTVMTIVQMAGRICRHESDHGTTYILDSDFNRLWTKNGDMFPDWFKEAVVFNRK